MSRWFGWSLKNCVKLYLIELQLLSRRVGGYLCRFGKECALSVKNYESISWWAFWWMEPNFEASPRKALFKGILSDVLTVWIKRVIFRMFQSSCELPTWFTLQYQVRASQYSKENVWLSIVWSSSRCLISRFLIFGYHITSFYPAAPLQHDD